MTDPVAGLREMARVTRDGGVVAATVWDHGGGQGPLSVYWDAVHELDPAVEDESKLAGAREGDLSRLFRTAGLQDIVETEPLGLRRASDLRGLVGAVHARRRARGRLRHAVSMKTGRARLRELCQERLPEPPFEVRARAWAARGRVGSELTAA